MRLLLLGMVAGLAVFAGCPSKDRRTIPAGSGTKTSIEPFRGLQLGMHMTDADLGSYSESHDVRGKIYEKSDTWDLAGKRYDIMIILGLNELSKISMITISFPYPGKMSEDEAKVLDQAIYQYFADTYDRSILELSRSSSDWPGLLSANGSNNISVIYEFIPETWLQIDYVHTK